MELNTTVVVDNLKFPEGPRWHKGELWFSDYAARRVLRADAQGHAQMMAELQDLPAAVDWTPEGRLLIVSAAARHLLSLENGALVDYADLSGLVPFPCGELVVDTQGRAYVGSVGYDLFKYGTQRRTDAPGSVLLVSPAGEARIVAEGLAFPNGMVISPDGQTLIVSESHATRLTAFHIEADGSLSQRRMWAQFDNSQMNPDGITLDADGVIWVASPVTQEVVRVRDDGEITSRIAIDGFPLACMLGGPKRRTLFICITTSLNMMDSSTRGRIESTQVEVAGAGQP